MNVLSNAVSNLAEKTAETSVDYCIYVSLEETDMPAELIERD
jgi:hypothetical protein